MSASGPRILISLATYNERGNLEALLKEIHAQVPGADILVTDDNSPDGTGQLADELAAADPRIHVNHRTGKLGLGTAILGAMHYALDNNYDLFINMDADFSHHPRYLPAILAGMEQYDVMIGSRYVPEGGTENWPLSRKVMSRGVNTLTRILMRMPARDTSGAYRCYRVSKLRQVPLDRVQSRGYSFQQEVLFRCYRAGCTLGETPIIFAERRAGSSKVDLMEAVRSIAMICYLGVRSIFRRD